IARAIDRSPRTARDSIKMGAKLVAERRGGPEEPRPLNAVPTWQGACPTTAPPQILVGGAAPPPALIRVKPRPLPPHIHYHHTAERFEVIRRRGRHGNNVGNSRGINQLWANGNGDCGRARA